MFLEKYIDFQSGMSRNLSLFLSPKILGTLYIFVLGTDTPKYNTYIKTVTAFVLNMNVFVESVTLCVHA